LDGTQLCRRKKKKLALDFQIYLTQWLNLWAFISELWIVRQSWWASGDATPRTPL
jgi:hypothetical protein